MKLTNGIATFTFERDVVLSHAKYIRDIVTSEILMNGLKPESANLFVVNLDGPIAKTPFKVEFK